jgi:hypothetical protein
MLCSESADSDNVWPGVKSNLGEKKSNIIERR